MAATGKTPILLYGSTTASNVPTAGNLTNSSDGCEIAINVTDKNLFFKDSTNAVNTVPIRQSNTSSNGWLSSTDWNTFNGKASTSSPTFSGDVTLGTGNLVIGTSGKGIDFSATAGTGTSELLADYEEGTWTPTQGAGLTVVGTFSSVGYYTKVGRLVTVNGYVAGSTSVAFTGGTVFCGGLPYTAQQYNVGNCRNAAYTAFRGIATAFTDTNLYAVEDMAATTSIAFTITYWVN